MALCARLDQPKVNRIINGKQTAICVTDLTCICLALQISVEQSNDLLARAERAFSPALKTHSAYIELIEIYANMPFDCLGSKKMLDMADNFMRDRGLPEFPNIHGYIH